MKKFLAFLLSFAMICSMMTVVIFADSESNETVEENENVIALELVELDDEQLATLSYVPFSSGVYRFDSMYNTGMCMMVEDGEYTSGALVVQWNTSSNARDTLFKVEHAGTGIIPATSSTADYYVIRSMVNSEIGLTAAPIASGSNAVTLQSLDADNDNQMWTQYWVHMEDSGCDVWMNAATGTCLGSPDGYANGSSLEMSSGGATTWWQLVEYDGPVIEDIVFTTSSTSIYGGGHCYFDAYVYSSRIGVNGPVSFEVRGEDGNPTDKEAEINANTGYFYAKMDGVIDVYAYVPGTTCEKSISVTINGYASADLAAIGFGERYFDLSYADQLQYATSIYMGVFSGAVCYDYLEPVLVSSSAEGFVVTVPDIEEGTLVAVVHTAPLTSGIQDYDEDFVNENELDCYVAGVNHSVYVYEYIEQASRLVGYH